MFRRGFQLLAWIAWLAMTQTAFAGGPRWVAGSSYFDPAVKGQAVHWKNGTVTYYTDPSGLSVPAYHTLINGLVTSSFAAWSGVPTAAVNIVYGGNLSEDVSGSNVIVAANGSITMPADIQPTAISRPLGIVYDVDGTVINAFFGPGASDPSDCRDNGVMTIVDNVAMDGTIAHALMLLNGLCAANNAGIAVMQYQMVRAMGRILGLDWSQANESMFVGDQITADGLTGWPIMHPVEYVCSVTGNPCTSEGTTLRYDDMAAISRLYPVTSENISSFPGKKLTAASTISVTGTIHFSTGQGMQGVNVVLRPLRQDTGMPDIRYTVTAVSGAFFQRSAANPVNGANDNQGNPLNEYGSDDPSLEGHFDLSGIPLPIGETIADYQLSFEPLNPLYSAGLSVGPYTQGQVSPSGTMPVLTLHGLTAGISVTEDIVIQDSADESYSGNNGTEAAPVRIPSNGEWTGRITGYGDTSWLEWPVRPNRELTVEATALDETGAPSEKKARLVLGAWNGTDAANILPVSETPQAYNGDQTGLTTLSVATVAQGYLRLGIADQRGDGRPDYLYRGRLLYADSVMPSRLALSGGPITIYGTGFQANSVVTINGVRAAVTSVTPTAITAIAPPANGAKGTILLTVSDPLTLGVTAIQDGLSYDAMGGDALSVVTAPYGSVSLGALLPFTVKALAADGQTPAAGINVTFTVTEGAATLGCGKASCVAISGADGSATMSVAANSAALTQVTASLSDGASVLTEFTGSSLPSIVPLTPNLYVAISAAASWSPQAQLLSNGMAVASQQVMWSAGQGVTPAIASSLSNANGITAGRVMVSPLSAGASVPVYACLPGNSSCAQFEVFSVHPEEALLVAVSGAGQTMTAGTVPAPVVLRVTDAVGHPMAGGVVTFYETLKQWTPACPAQGRCPSAPVLATQIVSATSDAEGTVTLIPLMENGVATRLNITAVTGEVSSLNFEIEEHP